LCTDFFQGIFSNLVAVNVGLFGALIAVAVFVFGIKYWIDSIKMKEIAKEEAANAAEKAAIDTANELKGYMKERVLMLHSSWYKTIYNLEKNQSPSKNKKDILVFAINEMVSQMIIQQEFSCYGILLETCSNCLEEFVKINKRDDDFKDLKKSVVMLIDAYDKLDKSKEDQESKNQLNKIIQTIKENMKKI
jgi:hypothetical protein